MGLFSQHADGLTVSTHHRGSHLVVTLSGRLDLDAVEDLAACADRICRDAVQARSQGTAQATGQRDAVRVTTFDVGPVVTVDDAGARTLAAACRCLAWHGVAAEVRGVSAEVREVLGRLGLRLPEATERAPAMRARAGAPRTATAPAGR